MELVGSVNSYQWGKEGTDSVVAQLAQLNSIHFTAEPNTPYSEFWMGDHPSGPSKIKATGEELGAFISKNKEANIGSLDRLPFLFKVLSIKKALSIQVHPNKEEAEKLHAEHPDIYKDPNHKPELAIALTPFKALCGFRPYTEIADLCQKFPPLLELIGADNVAKLDGETGQADALKVCYAKLMTSSQEKVSSAIANIEKNFKKELIDLQLDDVFETLNKDFPGDVGILCIFIFNLLRLKPGQAIYLGAKEPHAYLDGDCIECMACSDNVIRAGLTPKFKDIPTLLEMLNYNAEPAQNKLFQPTRIDTLDLFIPPVKDFSVGKISIPVTNSFYQMKNEKFGSILLVLEGEAILKTQKYEELSLRRGSVIFIPGDAGEQLEFYRKQNDHFTAYLAMYNFF